MQTIGILPDFFKKKGSKMNRAKRVYRRLLGKKPKTYASSPTGSLPPSPIGGRSPAVLRRNTFKRSRMSLNRMWRRLVNFQNTYLVLYGIQKFCTYLMIYQILLESWQKIWKIIKQFREENEGLSNSFPWGYQFRKMQHMISVSSEHIACTMKKYTMKLPLYMQI